MTESADDWCACGIVQNGRTATEDGHMVVWLVIPHCHWKVGPLDEVFRHGMAIHWAGSALCVKMILVAGERIASVLAEW